MNVTDKLQKLEEIMDLEEGTLQASNRLEEIEEWDSITHLSLIITLEEDFGKQISGKTLRNLKTVQEILDLME